MSKVTPREKSLLLKSVGSDTCVNIHYFFVYKLLALMLIEKKKRKKIHFLTQMVCKKNKLKLVLLKKIYAYLKKYFK